MADFLSLGLLIYTVITGAATLGRAKWGRFRNAGVTKIAFDCSLLALFVSVALGWGLKLDIHESTGLEPFAIGYAMSLLALGFAWLTVRNRPKFKSNVFMALAAGPVLMGLCSLAWAAV